MEDRLSMAWLALCRQLELRGAQLLEEVRGYPTPIARCDVQLTRLLEQRDQAFGWLRQAHDLQGRQSSLQRAAWCARLREFANGLDPAGDAALAAARARVLDTRRR